MSGEFAPSFSRRNTIKRRIENMWDESEAEWQNEVMKRETEAALKKPEIGKP